MGSGADGGTGGRGRTHRDQSLGLEGFSVLLLKVHFSAGGNEPRALMGTCGETGGSGPRKGEEFQGAKTQSLALQGNKHEGTKTRKGKGWLLFRALVLELQGPGL